MSVLLLVAAIYFAAMGVWWASFITFVMGLAYAYDYLARQREAEQARNRRCRAELRHHRQEVEQ